MRINLTPRLLCAAQKVKNVERIVDIGTDHGYVPIYLILNGIIKSAIASDINKGPLNRAYENIKRYNLLDKIDLRLSDGFSNIKNDEADCALVLGMGGLLISNILKESIHTNINTFILQPMQAQEKLREYLYNNNFIILDEELVKEGDKIYNIITVKRGIPKRAREIDYFIGQKLIENKDPLLPQFLDRKISEFEKIREGLKLSKNEKDKNIDKLLLDFKKIQDSI